MTETAQAWLDAWRHRLICDGKAPRSVAAYGRDVAGFLAVLAESGPVARARLAGLAARDLYAYFAYLEGQGAKHATILRKAASLRRFFDFLCAQGVLMISPMDGVMIGAAPRRRAAPIAPGDLARLLAAAEALAPVPWMGKRDRLLFGRIARQGDKIGTLLGLDLAAARTWARPDPCLETYLTLYPFDPHPAAPLFPGRRGGRLDPGVVQRQLRRLRAHLGISVALTPERLRGVAGAPPPADIT